MNELDRAEVERLKRQQEALQLQLAGLSVKIEQLASRLNAAASATPEIQPLEMRPFEIAPESFPAESKETITPPVPLVIPPLVSSVGVASAIEPVPTSAPTAHDAPASVVTPVNETFEMKLGTYWLVRIGIVMLLTGLVFLGTYAYKNFVGKFGAPAKVGLLYAASAALLGLGGWLQRKREKEALQNYGQVLFAGGLAATYFTTYAAHYVPVLRVIGSPFADALLLLAWAAVTVLIADRRKSEVLALFAVGLSYYTSAITDVGLFTLCSNLVLTAAAVFFLIRNRWTKLSVISVLATYGGFAFWRFHHGDWGWYARMDDLWSANFFLAGYWLFFTAAVFFSRGATLANTNRALFASLNNGAFFVLVLLSMLHVPHWSFWKLSLGFGTALVATALAAGRLLSNEPVVRNAYLAQGLILVTAGFVAYFSGLKLALVLAAESVALTFLGAQQKSFLLRAVSGVTAALSVAWVMSAMTDTRADILLGFAIGAGFLLNAWWEQRHDEGRESSLMRPFSGYFVALAILTCASVTWRAVPGQWRAVAWMLEAVALTFAFYVVRIRELPILAQALAIAAQGYWFFEFALRQERPHWAVPTALIAGTLALSHWWQRQERVSVGREARNLLQIVYGLALVGVLFFWFQPKFAPAAWLAFLNVLAIGITLYGVATRAWTLAACGQLFLLISSVEFFRQFLHGKPPWELALVPIATWLVLGTATTAYLARNQASDDVRRPLLQVSTFYRGVAFVMSVWWVFAYVPVRNHFWVLCFAGLALFAFGGVWRSREMIVFSALYLLAAFSPWFARMLDDASVVNWPNALAILGVLAAQQVTRRLPHRYELPAHANTIVILVTGLALWAFVSRWVVLTSGAHFLLTASWAALAAALFGLGFVLRERVHRWLGLAILGFAVARVFLSDVWKLETIYRILSFMALGIVLLVLGFVYNKCQEKIRHWL
jgi:uncharacterized membrane protein